MEGLKIIKKPKLKKPYLIVAWPGMGNVAFRAAKYLAEELKARELAQLLAQDFFYPTGSIIQEGVLGIPELPQGNFYYWKNPGPREKPSAGGLAGGRDIIIFISNSQPDLARATDYSQRIIRIAKMFKVETVVSFASMPQPVDHTQEAGVWFASTSAELNSSLKKYNFNFLSEGNISGMNGLFLGIAKKEGLKGFCLFGEIPLYTIQIDNPKASCAVLRALARVLNIKMDFSSLIEQAHTMEEEINKLLDYLKLGPQAQSGPIGEEEVERIKKTLSQLTKLPVSVKERIEKLFEQSKNDIAQAGGLKAELDKWNVYSEYEDRFLDLFKKNKAKDN
ncbi:MAG: PAC2 family protein [Candidatus Omnitrophica bacterium]|nr:PAC2 family protein [Candidatus Omnitrophota bacterium]MBL7210660.1 PAC2 family protein [Candidatus Omnitrophota bacterium]